MAVPQPTKPRLTWIQRFMAIFRRTSVPPQPSTPPQDNIERGDNVVIPATPKLPKAVTTPTISGQSPVGSLFTATPGTWENQASLAISGAWYRDGIGIPGANNLTYVTVNADNGKTITYRETASNPAGTTTSISNIINASAPTGSAPTILTIPTMSAPDWRVGHKITGVPGTFTGATSVANRWTRNNVDINGYTGTEYTPTILDIGTVIRFVSRGVNAFGAVDNASVASVVIQEALVTQPPNDKLYDFTLSSTVPTGVTVARAGTAGTYVGPTQNFVVAAANTPRIDHDPLGRPRGLLVEKERTNILANGKGPFGTGWTALGSAKLTANAANDLVGGSTAGRMEIPLGSGYNGARYAVGNGSPTTVLIQYYAQSKTGQNGDMTGINTGAIITPGWNRTDKVLNIPANYNFDLVSKNATAIDSQWFGVGIYPGGQLRESVILTTGSPVTRPKEVVTFTGPTNYFYDVRVRLYDGSYVDFLNQIVNGTWVLDADMLPTGPLKNIVRQVAFHSPGSLPDSEPPGLPGDPPIAEPPPPPPPPPAGGEGVATYKLDNATMTAVARVAGGWDGISENFPGSKKWSASTTRYEGNEALIEGIGYINSGFRNGRADGFGAIWRRQETPNGHIPNMLPNDNYNDSTWSNYCDPWMVFCHEQGKAGGIGWMNLRKLSGQWQSKTDNLWRWIFHWHSSSPVYRSSRIGWSPNWVTGPAYDQGYDPAGGDRPAPDWDPATGVASLSIKGGGTIVNGQYAGYACHFTFADAQFQYVPAADVKNFLFAAEVKRDPRSHPSHSGLVHLGMDPKFRSSPPGGGEVWPGGVFPPSSISQTIKLTNEWRPIFCAPITGDDKNQRVQWISTMNSERPYYPF